ncbi:MAG TPA: glycosyltransferase, partial [Thermoanaerobaculia bacterium]|nr:glycosyltransferase [Thermoanaerobaculia bacterium]
MTPRVSVIVPFLNAGKFLAAAIESVLAQKTEDWELLLVDDGSKDGSGGTARSYADRHPGKIRVLEHPGHVNLGVCASRNLGVREARGDLVALLDADDVWLPEKLREQVAILDAHPSAAMVYGHSKYWRSWMEGAGGSAADHTPALGVELDRVHEPPTLALRLYPLAKGTAPCPSDLLLRKELVERIGGFEERFHREYQLYEDQAFLSKVYLNAAVYVSSRTWDLYRIHPASCDAAVIGSGRYHEVRRFFLEWLEGYYRDHGIADPALRAALGRALFPYRHPLLERVGRMRDLRVADVGSWARDRLASARVPRVGRVRLGMLRRTEPISRRFGFDRGLPIDRVYIERFLDRNRLAIRGRVVEVGDDAYTVRFGGDRVARRDVLNVSAGAPGTTIVADLARADGVPSESFDCILLTQTLQYVWDLAAAVRTLRRLVAPGGVVLATFPGLTPIARLSFGDRWYWGLTGASARKLFGDEFGAENVEVESHGNVLASIGFLHGLASEELTEAEIALQDPAYQLLITVRATKPSGAPPAGRRVEAVSIPPLASVRSVLLRPGAGDVVDGDLVVEASFPSEESSVPAAMEVRAGSEVLARAEPATSAGTGRFAATVEAQRIGDGRAELVVTRSAGTDLEIARVYLAERRAAPSPLVSIVIPCYNHAGFLPDALASCLKQTHPNVEVLVVDDGSTDDSAEVASRAPGVRVVRQPNRGLSAARNTGIEQSRGEYLLFLDADDRLLPEAVSASVRAALDHPECAFVFGRFHVINGAGAWLLTSESREMPKSPYAALLETNWIVMHGTVLYRRETFREVGLFDTALRASEDYDMYLRVSRRFPIASHDAVVAEVRKHRTNMTRNLPHMLEFTLAALGRQREHARERPDLWRGYRKGVRFWKRRYGQKLANELKVARFERRWKEFFA